MPRLSPRDRRRLVALARGLLRLLALIVAPPLALLVLAELTARVAAPAPAPETEPMPEMVPHPTRIWSLPPSGLRAGGLSYPVRPDLLRAVRETGAPHRVLTLGDSSIFGHGLEDGDTLHARLSEALGAKGIDTDVYCGGVPGYSTAQSLLLLEEVGWDLEPDLLVIGDLWSDNSFQYFVDAQWLEALDSPAHRLDRALGWSRAWGWLKARTRPPEATTGGALPIGWVRAPYTEKDGRRRVALGDYGANLDQVLTRAAARGVGAVFLAPSNRTRLEPDGSLVMWEPYFSVMRQVAARRGVPLVDATEALRAAGLSADQAFLDMMHPTAAGNAAYAAALAEVLLERGWPSERLIPDPGPPPVVIEATDPFEGPH